ncbi:MAG: 3-dehydroquinate synthase II, partial [Desulfovibrio sp.]|nr:3-dehydroquinate synthase II [Desulfovibrio sp.]
MSRIYFNCVPFDKGDVTLALESGVDGVIVPRDHVEQVAGLSRCPVWPAEETPLVGLTVKADEEAVLQRLHAGEHVVLARGWEVIPVENLLAQSDSVLVEAGTLDEARLAAGILERGVAGIVVSRAAVADLKDIVAQCKMARSREELVPGVITRVDPVGLGHRVCADTLSLLRKGQGML